MAGASFVLARVGAMVQMTLLSFYLENVCAFTPTATNPTPVSIALAPTLGYTASLFYSVFIQNKLGNTLIMRHRYKVFGYSIVTFLFSSTMLLLISKGPDEHTLYWIKDSLVLPP